MRNTLKAGKRPDPIFAAIKAHRLAAAARYPIMEKLSETPDRTAAYARLSARHDKALLVEVAATVKLRKMAPTTLAGVTALTAYYVERKDRDFDWMCGDAHPDDITFEVSVIRNLSAAMVQINSVAAISIRS